MKVLLKVLGVIEFIGGIILLIFFFINVGRTGFDSVTFTLILSLFVSGAIYFYLSSLGSRVDYLEDKIILDNRENKQLIDLIQKLGQRVKALEAKLNEKQSQESNKE